MTCFASSFLSEHFVQFGELSRPKLFRYFWRQPWPTRSWFTSPCGLSVFRVMFEIRTNVHPLLDVPPAHVCRILIDRTHLPFFMAFLERSLKRRSSWMCLISFAKIAIDRACDHKGSLLRHCPESAYLFQGPKTSYYRQASVHCFHGESPRPNWTRIHQDRSYHRDYYIPVGGFRSSDIWHNSLQSRLDGRPDSHSTYFMLR